MSEDNKDISPKNDGGVLKKIIKPGTGDELPPLGSKVTVHYVGKLTDGSVFDSSRERNEPFQFDLGKGSVIKAWDIGVATMHKGEIAELTCASDYAYGSSGSPPKIPPNATLIFEIEMISWVGEDLSPEKDFSIERQILNAGDGYMTPNDGSFVDVHLVGKYDGNVFDERDVQFSLGEGCEFDVIEGVERALEKFKKGETSKLLVKSKYAFKNNPNNKFNVPIDASVEYLVTLKTFEKVKDSWSMSSPEKLEQAKIYKEKGTKYFKASKYKLAAKLYKKINSLLTNIDEDELADQVKELNLSGHLNAALCDLKLGNYLEARDECKKAIELNASSEKAYFRLGQAYLELGEAELALVNFERVVELEPTNKAALNQINIAKHQIQQAKLKEKKIYANMFEKFAKRDSKREEEERRQQPDVMTSLSKWGEDEREREPTNFEKENPNIFMLNNSDEFKNM